MSKQDSEHGTDIRRHLKWIVVYLKFILKFQILTRLILLHVFAIYFIRMKIE